jgi:uncharacterized membrane protein (TIGR02234 family)
MKAFAAALAAQIVGAAAVLLIATREWQTITTVRQHPFADDVVGVSGRTVDGAVTALALVALAGVVAVIATKGVVRRVIGALVSLSGLGLVWRIAGAMPAVGDDRAREIVHAAHPQVAGTPQVVTHPIWAVLSLAGAALVVVAGLLTAWRGGAWAGLSARYDRAEVDPEQSRARADASLWTALERGDDPTDHDPREAR